MRGTPDGMSPLAVRLLVAASVAVTLVAGCGLVSGGRHSHKPARVEPLEKYSLPATPFARSDGSELGCPPPPTNHQLPPAIPDAPLRCLWVVKVDLDGNGRPDQLVVWQTTTKRGAVGYLDDGSVHPLEPQPATVLGRVWLDLRDSVD